MPLKYNNHKVIAIVPIYNEIGKIGKVIPKFSLNFIDEVCLILDDPSELQLKEVKESTNKTDVNFHLIINDTRRGIGFAIRLGIKYAIKNKFDIIVVLAGNNKDNPREIPRFLDAIIYQNYDYIQGSRFLPGGNHKNTPIFRGMFIKFYPLLWTIFTKFFCTDVTNGFRAYKTSIFFDKRINIWQKWLDDYELEYYLHYKVISLGYNVREVPVSKIYPYRHKGGYSQINPLTDFWKILSPLLYLTIGIKK